MGFSCSTSVDSQHTRRQLASVRRAHDQLEAACLTAHGGCSTPVGSTCCTGSSMLGRPLVAWVILQAKGADLRRVVKLREDWVFAKEGHGCILGDSIVVREGEEHLVASADIHRECLGTELLQVHQVLGCERARTVQVACQTSRTSDTAQHAITLLIPAFFRSSM